MSFLGKVLSVIFVVVIVVAAAGVSLYTTRDSKTRYVAVTKILVDQPQTLGLPVGATNVTKIQATIPTYAQVISSYSTAEKVAERLSDLSSEEVQASLTGKAVEKTQILVVEVNNRDSDKAVDIANEAAAVFIDNAVKQQDDDKLKREERLVYTVIEPAQVRAIVPQRQRTALISALAGFVVSLGAVIVFVNSRRTFYKED